MQTVRDHLMEGHLRPDNEPDMGNFTCLDNRFHRHNYRGLRNLRGEPPTLKPIIVHSDLTGNYYYSTRYKDLGDGKYEIPGRWKVDVTEQVNSIIEKAMEKYRVELARKGVLTKRSWEKI
jgi:hypothetical protein